jgi:hypothetical protein
MNFDPSPVSGLPSYLQMMKGGQKGSAMPRWWLATNYEPLLTDADGLAWELRGPGVKAMTEEDFLLANGERVHSGKASPTAQKWANNMTAKYDELSKRDPIFGQLRNCMDLAIVSALLFKENLTGKANLDLAPLMGENSLPVAEFPVPKQVDTQASFIKKGDNWIISASGGVLIHSWGDADRKEHSAKLSPVREKAARAASDNTSSGQPSNWWWN